MNSTETPNIVLLSCSFKHKLCGLLEASEDNESIVVDPNTDLQFLFVIRQYLIQSNNLDKFNVVLATRDNLQVREDGMYITGAQQLHLNNSDDITYPSPIDSTHRMEKFAGTVLNNARFPILTKRLISSAVATLDFKIDDSKSTMVFDFSEDEPAKEKHFVLYQRLINLFHMGMVQTNPYFILKRECHNHYGFSSSKNIPYIVCDNPDILIPGIITSDVNHALKFMAEHKKVVLKLQDGTGGKGISFFDAEMSSSAEAASKFRKFFDFMLNKQSAEDDYLGVPRRGLVLQKFLKGIDKYGDTRVHLINGKVCLIGQRRIPKGTSKLANVKAGASFHFVVLDDAEVSVCVEFAKCVRKYQPRIDSSHIGIDILKDNSESKPLISEINTWNICFIAETCDFLSSFYQHEASQSMYNKYQTTINRYKNSGISDYILQTSNIPAEAVGKYLQNLTT